MAGISELMEYINTHPSMSGRGGDRGYDPQFPTVKLSNEQIAEIIKSDPSFAGTNVGVNPAAYLDPRHQTALTTYALSPGRGREIHGEQIDLGDPRRDTWGRVWATTRNQTPETFLNTMVHENIHANTFEGPAREAAAQKRGDNPPFLYNQLMAASRDRLPPFKTNIGYEDYEPVAWIGAKEAFLPEGQMPIQEEMNKRGLGALYAHMTTAGPVATRLSPSLVERLRDYMRGEPSEEPYELRGNVEEKKRRNK